jgi:hypothetical protein
MEDWSPERLKPVLENNKDQDVFLYLYTPLCGTCQVAGKMIEVVTQLLPELQWGKCNLNFIPEYALSWEIESVPCLIIFRNQVIYEKIYAFRSVPYLYEKIKAMKKTNSVF